MATTGFQPLRWILALLALVPLTTVAQPGRCPDEGQIAAFRVSDQKPLDLQWSHIGQIQQALRDNADIDVQTPAGMFAMGAQLTGASFENVAINGLYQFLTERARLELESYLIDQLKEHLCGEYAPYFPRTCASLTRDDASGIFPNLTLAELRAPLEQDIRYLPACIIHKPKDEPAGSDIGYLLMDAFRQLTSGTDKSGYLMYGLASHSRLYEECRTKGGGDPNSAHCQVFEGMAALAAGIQVGAMAGTLTPEKTVTAFVTVYVYNLALFTCGPADRAGSFDQVTIKCGNYLSARFPAPGPGERYPVPVTQYLELAPRVLARVAEMTASIKLLAETGKRLSEASGNVADDYRGEIVGLLLQLAEQLAGGYVQGLCVTGDLTQPCDVTQLQAAIKPIREGLSAYAQFSAGNYVAGIIAMPMVSDQVRSKYLLPAARLAQAQTSDEFSAALNSIASPAGAWRLKKIEDQTWTVASFVGLQAGSERLEGRDTSSTGSYYGAYVPFGVAWSKRFGKEQGYWGVYLSALDLGVLASNHVDRDGADSGAETELSSVLSPSLSVYVNPGWLGPVTFGLGYAYRTPGLRTVTTATGDEIELDSSRVMFTIGVDVTVFRLGR